MRFSYHYSVFYTVNVITRANCASFMRTIIGRFIKNRSTGPTVSCELWDSEERIMDLPEAALAWLEHQNCAIISDSRAPRLQISSALTHRALKKAGIATPKTILAVSKNNI